MIIRRQMGMTKQRLTQKLEALEQQVTEKVQSAGTAVNATAAAVENAVHSVSQAFDLDRQFRRHPWLFVGSSVALGYIVTDLLRAETSDPPIAQSGLESNAAGNNGHSHNGSGSASNGHGTDPEITAHFAPPIANSRTSNGFAEGSRNPVGDELLRIAMGAFAGIAHDLVARSVPQVMNYFRGNPAAESGTRECCPDTVKPEIV